METIIPVFSQSQNIPGQLAYYLPEKIGTGGLTVEKLSSGLILAYMNITLSRPVTFIGETVDWNFGISFNLTGHSEIHSSEYRQIAARPGISVHYAYPGRQKIIEDVGVGHKSKVAVLFDSHTLQNLADEDEEPFLPFLKSDQNQISVAGQEKMDAEIHRALHELMTCPYRGKTRALYVEGKTMELFACTLEQMRPRRPVVSHRTRLCTTDRERIHYAAELLVFDPLCPPNLTELAAKIGMSRSRFYHNFKQVLGYTPMDYLRSHRLQLARKLLQQGSHNVSEAAFASGFNNLSYFTRAFTHKFGISPRQML